MNRPGATPTLLLLVLTCACAVAGAEETGISPELAELQHDYREVLSAPFDANGVALSPRARENETLNAQLEAARVTLRFNDLPLKAALAELSRMIRVPVDFENVDDNASLNVCLALKDVSAASALAHFGRVTNTVAFRKGDRVLFAPSLPSRGLEYRAYDSAALDDANLDASAWVVELICAPDEGKSMPELTRLRGRLIALADSNTHQRLAQAMGVLNDFARKLKTIETAGRRPATTPATQDAPLAKMHLETTPREKAWRAAIEARLRSAMVSYDCIDSPLHYPAGLVGANADVNIVFDPAVAVLPPWPEDLPETGEKIAYASAAVLSLLILAPLAIALFRRQRPRFSLRYLLAMSLAASIVVYGVVRRSQAIEAWQRYNVTPQLPELPINLRVSNMSGNLALEWTLRIQSLDRKLENEAIVVTPATRLVDETEPHLYYIRDLASNFDAGELADTLKRAVCPDAWDVALNTSAKEREGILSVWQNEDNHAVLAHVLEQMRQHWGERKLPIGQWVIEGDPVLKRHIDQCRQRFDFDPVKDYSSPAPWGLYELPEVLQLQFLSSEMEPKLRNTIFSLPAQKSTREELLQQVLKPLHLEYRIYRQTMKIGSHAFVDEPEAVLYDLSDAKPDEFEALNCVSPGNANGFIRLLSHQRVLTVLTEADRDRFERKVEDLLPSIRLELKPSYVATVPRN